jgi:hypothetical protein
VAGSAPRSERGGRRFKSYHSDQHLADFPDPLPTDIPTETISLHMASVLEPPAPDFTRLSLPAFRTGWQSL